MRLACLLVLAAISVAEQFGGVLDAHLTKPPGPRWRVEPVNPATDEQRAQLPLQLAPTDRVWFKDFPWGGSAAPRKLAVVEKSDGKWLFLADVNADGHFKKNELREFRPAGGGDRAFDVHLDLPLSSGPFQILPVEFRILGVNSHEGKPQLLHINDFVLVTGRLRSSTGQARVVFFYNPARGAIDPRNARLGIDANGDAQVDFGAQSPESARAENETVVFRVGERYLSFETVDVQNLRFTMRSHPASDYERIELLPGAQVPDFEFVDFSGARRRLSDFRGKHVLLDFWGSWCAPCVAQFPDLREVFAKFREHGFEIIGIDNDESQEAAEKVLAKNNCTWINARTESVKHLYEKRFRIQEWPTLVLLDPNGRILSTGKPGQPALDGKELETTLRQALKL